LKADISVIIIL